jgi:hypothetical protein
MLSVFFTYSQEQCHYAECLFSLIAKISVIMLSVVMPSGIMQCVIRVSVVEPCQGDQGRGELNTTV